MKRSLACLGAALALWGGAAAGATPSPDMSAQDRAHIAAMERDLASPIVFKGGSAGRRSLAQEMARLHVPGVSIAFIHDGHIAWTRGYGVGAIGGTPVTPQTLFQAGSISKPVTALAVLRLVQAGRLDLDTDVNRYRKGR